MKKFIINLFILSAFSTAVFSQTTVSGSIRKGASANVIEILAKPSANINAQVGNINITFSIPDRTSSGGNPSDASIIRATPLNNVVFNPTDFPANAANPYIIGNRAYYSYLILPNTSTDVPSMLTANTDNVIGSFTFPSSYDPGIRLEDLTSSGGGPNFQMTWYVQFNQGIGDVTNYDAPFYGYYNAADATNNAGAADQFVTLVVKFLNFSVTKQDNAALLTWQVENEGTNTASYEIEKSLNGVNFSSLGSVAPLNNGRTGNSYSFTQPDLSSIRTSGVIYFRVKQVDRDGKFVYTPIRSVRVNSKGLLVSVYPNPVKSDATVVLDLPQATDVILKVINAAGQQVMTSQVKGVKGANFSNINMAKLATGAYTLNVQAGTEIKTMTIVKAEQ